MIDQGAGSRLVSGAQGRWLLTVSSDHRIIEDRGLRFGNWLIENDAVTKVRWDFGQRDWFAIARYLGPSTFIMPADVYSLARTQRKVHVMRSFWCSERCPAPSTPQPSVHISALTQFETMVDVASTLSIV